MKTIVELTKDLIAAPSCCKELKEIAAAYLEAIGTDGEAAAAANFVAEMEEDIVPIEGLLAFAQSEFGAKVFGDKVPEIVAHTKERMAAGEKWCDCPACAACEALLARKDEILK